MAIDIKITDGIASSITEKLYNIGNAANFADKKIVALQNSLNRVSSGKLSAITGRINSVGSTSSSSRRVEPANVTAVKELQKQRDAITKVIEGGLKEREKAQAKADKVLNAQNAKAIAEEQKRVKEVQRSRDKLIGDIEKSSAKLSNARNLQNSIKSNTGLNLPTMSARGRNSAQTMYDNLFGANNIKLTTNPASTKAITDAISANTGTGIKRASGVAQKQQQAMYNDLFNAKPALNLTTSATSSKALANAISANTGTGIKQATATALKQRQAMYDSLFAPVNTSALSQQAQASLARAQAASNAQASPRKLATRINETQLAPPTSRANLASQQAMYDNLFTAIPRNANNASSSVSNLGRSLSGVNSAGASATQGLRNVTGGMSSLESAASFLRSDGLRWAKVLWALSGATLTAGALVSMADAYTRVQNRLSVVATSQQQVNALTQQIGQASINSRQPLEETAKTFARIDLSMKNLGRSQKDSLQITQNVAKALKLGGASAGESASALLQLSQAFNKGKLDGDEFRSVMENSPILADKFAQKLGVTRGELLKLAPLGKITAKVMADAILSATNDIDTAFNKLRPTVAESFTVLRTQATLFFGELDKQLGITSTLSSAVLTLGNHLDTVAFIIASATPLLLAFAGKLAISGFIALGRYALSAGASISAIRSPITAVALSLTQMGRTAIASFSSLATIASTATGRIYLLNEAILGTSGVLAIAGAAARRTGAMIASAFSFGNILLIITTLIAAVIAFGDKWIISAKDGINARDVLLAAWEEFKDFAVDVFNTLYDAATVAFGGVADQGMSTSDKLSDSFDKVGLAVAVTIDAIVTLLTNLWNIVKSTVYFLGDTIYNVVALLVNSVVSLVNTGIDGLNKLSQAANSILDATHLSNIVGNFGELGKASGMEYKSQFLDSLGDFKNSHDVADAMFVAKDRIMERAKKNALNRKSDVALRESGKDLTKADDGKKKKKKGGISREELLRRENAEQEKLIASALRYGDAKEALTKVDEVNEKLTQHHFKTLSDGEKSALIALVKRREEAQRVGKAQDALYESSYEASMAQARASTQAAQNMYNAGVIGKSQFESALDNATEKFQKATDSAYEFKKALKDVEELSFTYGADKAGKTAVQSARQSAIDNNRAMPDDKEVYGLATKKYRLSKSSSAYESAMDSTVGATEDNIYAMDGLNKAFSTGAIAVDTYNQKMATLNVTKYQLDMQMNGLTDWTQPVLKGLNQLVSDMPTLGEQMATAITDTVGTAVDGLSETLTNMITDWDSMADSASKALNRPATVLETMRYAVGSLVKQIGTELVGAIVKMGVKMALQWAIQKALSTAANTTAVAESVATGAAITAAMTPAATTASIATMGTAPATGAAAMATAMASMLAMIPAFADGSDIIRGGGNSRSDSILARLSHGEMVMNAQATKNNIGTLRAMQSGATIGGSSGNDNSTNITIIINSDGSTSSSGDQSSLANELVPLVRATVDKRMTELSKQGQPLERK